ncbi:unnamed protein product [Caenorhabditis sp. 36 PRJEB53466]|nr:unnamed protein product [Caenorhabditis sp. 36 PRJEB53466]
MTLQLTTYLFRSLPRGISISPPSFPDFQTQSLKYNEAIIFVIFAIKIAYQHNDSDGTVQSPRIRTRSRFQEDESRTS